MMLTVEKVTDKLALELVFKIRKLVFVVEQQVNAADEYDENEIISSHFLATVDGIPVGAARWRVTENGVKLERFAVLAEARGNGVGTALVAAVLADVDANPEAKGKLKYLNAQLSAMPLYVKFGFQKVGDMFEECNIQHYRMELA